MHEFLPNLRHLDVLRAVARLGSVTAAAREVHLSQPAVTQALAAMEHGFGATLFVRTSRGVVPTPAGGACAVRVGRALEQLRDGLPEVGRAGRAGDREPLRAITAAQLQALVAIVDEGAFGRAARAAGVARATVHRAARQLERALGVPLFEGTSHGVRPTRDAERLARRVQLAAAELAQARDEVAELSGVERGGTVIGAMPLARSAIVPAAVLAFAARRPGHAIAILDGPYESMLDALRRGRADVLVGALRESPPDDVAQEHLFDDPLAIVVRAGHPLAGTRASGGPAREALLRYPWIAPRAGSPLRRHYDALVGAAVAAGASRARGTGAARGLTMAAVECNSLVAARALLLASDRLMLSSAHQVHHELATGQLAALPHPSGRVVRAIGLTTRRHWQPTGAQRELIDELRRHAGPFVASSEVPAQPGSEPAAARNARGETRIRRVKKRVK